MKLKDFVIHKMRMFHIYQPVMIKTLLKEGGVAEKNLIAKKILEYEMLSCFPSKSQHKNLTIKLSVFSAVWY